ncbi:hypothetical protein EG329_014465 [Mollisiaceae sp. DMI_Dod_QoI]|nr:hypothetical protein EG329_014465 [Helotiales sp. DMI_Dod_QoI]
MSSRNGASKISYHGSKKSSDNTSSLISKQHKASSGPRSSPSHKPREQSSSSIHLAGSAAARAPSPAMSYPSYATSMLDSMADTYQAFDTTVSNRLVFARVDLLSVSAWSSSYEGPHQGQGFQQQPCDSKQSSACPYHASMMDSNNRDVSSGYGLAPLERWIDEDVGDGGALALQFGHQLRLDCTCTAAHDDIGRATMNGTHYGFAPEN